MDFSEDIKVVNIFSPASRSSAATGDYVSLAKYDKVRFIIQTGAVTAGGNVIFKEAVNASGSSAATLNFSKYLKMTASTDTYTKTSADSSTSADCITIANADDNKVWQVQIDARELTEGFDFVTCTLPAAFSAALTNVVAVCYKPSYAGVGGVMPTAIA
jgi:hypothetical protein